MLDSPKEGKRRTLALCLLCVGVCLPATGAPQRGPRLPRTPPIEVASVQGVVQDAIGHRLPGVEVKLEGQTNRHAWLTVSDAEGIFRFARVLPGRYSLELAGDGLAAPQRQELALARGEARVLELKLPGSPYAAPAPVRKPVEVPSLEAASRILNRRSNAPPMGEPAAPLPPYESVFGVLPNRWEVRAPEWDRYGARGPYPYTRDRPLDPYNRNRLKGDYQIFGQRVFLNIQIASDTLAAGRRLPITSNVGSARPGSAEFFGRGGQFFLTQNLRVTLDLFRGDAGFRPFDARVRITPAANINYLHTQENGIVNVDVRKGTTRTDAHFGLQEAFVEMKLADVSRNYDFLSVRAGIQPFSSDFRGFLFVEEQPGLRVFGNLFSNRWEYNLAYFYLLEKDTNSGLNTFRARNQQVGIASLYIQDFLRPGYTTQFSLHLNKDDGGKHFDDNGFLVRPAPVGSVASRNLSVAYLGWSGSGHFGRLNVSHAFYQALGRDEMNPIAGRRVTVNAQMAAAELSLDRDWLRYRASVFWASGDARPRDARARGFDTIVDAPAFAGGIFSFWNSQAIRLTGTGVALVGPNSLLPSLRSNKEEGKANFVNPGILVVNAGADAELTPKLRGIFNVNYLRFVRTEPVELLLFQAPVRHTIGTDVSLGFQYRPPLTENIVLTFGGAALVPGQGFADIYSRKTLLSIFLNLRFLF
jgi:hypothetical protein